MKRVFICCLMAMSLSAVAVPVAIAAPKFDITCTMNPEKAAYVMQLAAGPMSAAAGYTITAGELMDGFYSGAATITDAGFTSDYEQIWEVKYGGITLCVIENI